MLHTILGWSSARSDLVMRTVARAQDYLQIKKQREYFRGCHLLASRSEEACFLILGKFDRGEASQSNSSSSSSRHMKPIQRKQCIWGEYIYTKHMKRIIHQTNIQPAG